jgi:hypothetical protein
MAPLMIEGALRPSRTAGMVGFDAAPWHDTQVLEKTLDPCVGSAAAQDTCVRPAQHSARTKCQWLDLEADMKIFSVEVETEWSDRSEPEEIE